jgi:hypothetical protein
MLTYKQFLQESFHPLSYTAEKAYDYFQHNWRIWHDSKVPGRLKKILEDKIKTSPHYAWLYASDFLQRRWPEAEPIIAADGSSAYCYAKNLIGKRWPEGEGAIIQNGYIHEYSLWLKQISTEQDRRKWLAQGVTKNLVTIFNYMEWMPKRIQEYIISKRPDLIGEIWELDPELKAKYSHEYELGQVDL